LPVLSITQLQAQLSEAESGMIGNEWRQGELNVIYARAGWGTVSHVLT
jgi:hypothetical protein